MKVSEKLEKPSLSFVNKEDGQVTRVTYPNDDKIGSKLKTGDRIWLYYVNEEVILESLSLKNEKEKNRQETIDKIGKVNKEVSKGIYTGIKDVPKNITKNIGIPFVNKRQNSDKND